MPKTIGNEQLGVSEEEKVAPPFWFDDDDDSLLSDDETDLQAQPFFNVMKYMEESTAPCGEAFWAPVLGDYCCNEETTDINRVLDSRGACATWSESDKVPTEPTRSLISSVDSLDDEDAEMKDEMYGTVDEENEKIEDGPRVSKNVIRSIRHHSESRHGRSFPIQTKEQLPVYTEKDFQIKKHEESAKQGMIFNMLGLKKKKEEVLEPVEYEWVGPTLEELKTRADGQHELKTETEKDMKTPVVEPESNETSEDPKQDSIEIPASLWEELMQSVTQGDGVDEETEVRKNAQAMDSLKVKEVSEDVDEYTSNDPVPKITENEIGVQLPTISEKLQSNCKHSEPSIKVLTLAEEYHDESNEEEEVNKQPKTTPEERGSFDEELKNTLALTAKSADEKTMNTKDKQATSKPCNVWKMAKDKSTGRHYYFNRLTRKSTWTRPVELEFETDTLLTVVESNIVKKLDQGIKQEMHKPQNLWKKVKDPSSGRYYYYNRLTRESSWTIPREAKTQASTSVKPTGPEDKDFKESGPPKPKVILVSSRKSLSHLLGRKSLFDEASLSDRKHRRSWNAFWGSFRGKKDFSNHETSN